MSRSQKSWQRLPDAPLRIDRSAPQAKRLALYAHLETGHNLATGRLGTVLGGVPARTVGRFGVERLFTGAESIEWSDGGPTASTDISFCCILRINNVSVGDKRIIGVGAIGAGNGGMWLATDFGALGFVKPSVVGAYSAVVLLTVNQDYYVELAYRHSTGAVRLYARNLVTGVVKTDTLTNATAWASSDGIYAVGKHRGSGANTAFPGTLSYAAAYPYTRSLAETEMLAANPWQLLPSTRRPSSPILSGLVVTPAAGVKAQAPFNKDNFRPRVRRDFRSPAYRAPGAYSASTAITGTLAATLAGVTLSSASTLTLSAQLALTLAAVTSAATATLALAATSSNTLAAATSASTGQLTLNATLAATLADATVLSAATLQLRASLAQTLANATVAAVGNLPLAASATPTLAALTLGSASTLSLQGDFARTLGAVLLASTGNLPIVGSLSATLAAATLASASTIGNVPINGSAAITLDAATVSSQATLMVQAALAATLGNASLSAQGQLLLAATLARQLGDATLASAATTALAASLSATLAGATLASTGTVGTPATPAGNDATRSPMVRMGTLLAS